jgi:hypothetical protein
MAGLVPAIPVMTARACLSLFGIAGTAGDVGAAPVAHLTPRNLPHLHNAGRIDRIGEFRSRRRGGVELYEIYRNVYSPRN